MCFLFFDTREKNKHLFILYLYELGMLSLCLSESQHDNLLYSNHKLVTHVSKFSCPTHPRAVQMAQGIHSNLQKLTSTGAYSGNSYLMWK